MASLSAAGITTRDIREDFGLRDSEKFWASQQPFFQSKGYQLRPRYRPGWVKSWGDDPGLLTHVEDAITCMMPALRVMDGIRISDGAVILFKRILRTQSANEIEISRYLSQEDFLTDRRNHCVPLLDVLDSGEGEDVFLVMPLLRDFEDPELESVDDAVDFVGQTLEGLSFMHEKGVAHRDCARYNVMMDAKSIFPDGFHPQNTFLTPDALHYVTARRRYQVPYPKYYLIDFGLSTRSHAVGGTLGQDKTVPEFENIRTAPHYQYDPFPVDVYILGKLYKDYLLAKFRNVSFLAPLVDRMTAKDPANRPSAAEALELFQTCRQRLSPFTMCRRLTPAKQNIVFGIIYEGWHLGRRLTSKRRAS
ncbi:hypothetical protein BOTBODRAFT_106372 [Botryobasidium botryosum FD-172 SS1]|uniref:Protein kinase domain-containing protein n=1 Tax=Botryobasidium botryosum (strain FD-172 SS1) TaxID=930990 RepID=A0A067MYM3_BOTB1|nr:hypothetical protein BOTBODRAFT_106372 [Botryobasidium botryosum FD-172 SS1]